MLAFQRKNPLYSRYSRDSRRKSRTYVEKYIVASRLSSAVRDTASRVFTKHSVLAQFAPTAGCSIHNSFAFFFFHRQNNNNNAQTHAHTDTNTNVFFCCLFFYFFRRRSANSAGSRRFENFTTALGPSTGERRDGRGPGGGKMCFPR